jgi:hypothetical protein
VDPFGEQLLDTFAGITADKRNLGAHDLQRFYALSLELYRAKLPITGVDIQQELQRCGFDAYTALKLGVQFQRNVRLFEDALLFGCDAGK